MTIWLSIVIVGVINYLTRLGSIVLVDPKKMNSTTKQVLSYVPSAVFPCIIFPAVFFDNSVNFVNIYDPKILGTFIAFIFGYYSKNLLLTIVSGLISYWTLIYLL